MRGVKVNIRLLHRIVVYITVKKFPAGQPTAEATGPRLRGLPLRVLVRWCDVAPRRRDGLAGRDRASSSLVVMVALVPGGILQD